MRIAVVGCGYVAQFYLATLPSHPELQIAGVLDIDEERAAKYSAYFSVPKYRSFDELLQDDSVDLVINLTNPTSHYELSRACLEAGKHVYSEKPLASTFEEAVELVRLAKEKGLMIASAPSRFLAETAQTLWKAVRDNVIGPAYLVYAEMDDGMVHRMPYRKWINDVGIPWPYQDEFETGCTLEHAGYVVTILTAIFGPVKRITAFASSRIADKETTEPLRVVAPDFSVACLEFAAGMVARLTCSIVAPPDHSLTVFGRDGRLRVEDIWKPRCPVHVRRTVNIRRRTVELPWKETYPLLKPRVAAEAARLRGHEKKVDFCLGIAEMAAAAAEGRRSRISADFCLHTTEIVLAIHNAMAQGTIHDLTTSFEPMEPLPWAK